MESSFTRRRYNRRFYPTPQPISNKELVATKLCAALGEAKTVPQNIRWLPSASQEFGGESLEKYRVTISEAGLALTRRLTTSRQLNVFTLARYFRPDRADVFEQVAVGRLHLVALAHEQGDTSFQMW